MNQQLDTARSSLDGTLFQIQWTDTDFKSIDTAIKTIFEKRGWMK